MFATYLDVYSGGYQSFGTNLLCIGKHLTGSLTGHVSNIRCETHRNDSKSWCEALSIFEMRLMLHTLRVIRNLFLLTKPEAFLAADRRIAGSVFIFGKVPST
jgi:hypothetical protein